MAVYTSRIVKEGGSITNYASGASLAGASGALLDWSAGRAVLGTVDAINVGAAQTAACLATSKLKLATDLAASGTAGIFEIFDFGNGVKFFLSKSPNNASAAGSPGSLLLHLAGGVGASGARLYIKAGDNSPASAGWTKFNLDLASS